MLRAPARRHRAGEWEAWLAYFLAGVRQQAEDAVERIQRIDELLRDWRERIAAAPSRVPERALDLFAENPFWSGHSLRGEARPQGTFSS